jgi:hypothetical protein
MPLTRFLYMGDEVIVTFLETLLKREDLSACYFWISEYYFSGFELKTWDLLWKIFYDFYAIKYPKLEKYIIAQFTLWENNRHISYILDITLQLFRRKACPDVFIARHCIPAQKKHRGRPPKWLSLFPSEQKGVLLSIHNNCVPSMLFHMELLSYNDIYEIICHYFQQVKKMSLDDGYITTLPYSNKKHVVLALCLYLHLPESLVVLDEIDVTPASEDIAWITELNETQITPLYKTLPQKRLYAISRTIGCFDLQRFDGRCPPVKRLLGFHWEYFASFTPLWKKRFREHKAKRSKKEFEIIFKNDDYLEAFGELYNYEPDEQSNETQDKSVLSIERGSAKDWMKDIFGTEYDGIEFFPTYKN